MHLLPGVAIQPNLELKTWPKQLLGSLPLVIALPGDYMKYFLNSPKKMFFSLESLNNLKELCFQWNHLQKK